MLPTGDQETISFGDTAAIVDLPLGFTVVYLQNDEYRKKIHLTLSVDSVSRLNGGNITCDNTTTRKEAELTSPFLYCTLCCEDPVFKYVCFNLLHQSEKFFQSITTLTLLSRSILVHYIYKGYANCSHQPGEVDSPVLMCIAAV